MRGGNGRRRVRAGVLDRVGDGRAPGPGPARVRGHPRVHDRGRRRTVPSWPGAPVRAGGPRGASPRDPGRFRRTVRPAFEEPEGRTRIARTRAPWGPTRLALRVLRGLPSLLEAVLAAFLLTRIAGEQALTLELRPEPGVELDQRPGDAVAERPGLTAHPAARQAGDDVELLLLAGDAER